MNNTLNEAATWRYCVGRITVTPISDGYLDIPLSQFPKAISCDAGRLGETAPAAGTALRSAVNTFVVETGAKRVLIDSGAAAQLGPTMGRLPKALSDAGFDPASIDVVVLTHMHPDHFGGAISGTGEKAFPNADLVLHEADWAYFMSDENTAQQPDQLKLYFRAAQKCIGAYADRLRRPTGGEEIAPGLRLTHLPGHTPGHSGVVVSDGAAALLIWGDVVHSAPLQLAHPDWSISWDVDQSAAASTRMKVLDMVASDRLAVAGMHMPFPGVGQIERASTGYSFSPFPGVTRASQVGADPPADRAPPFAGP